MNGLPRTNGVVSNGVETNGDGKMQVLFLGKIERANDKVNHLKEFATIIEPKSLIREDFLTEANSGRFNKCKVALRTFDSYSITKRIDEELLESLPNLKFLCHLGAGYDQIDVSACTARGVHVSNTPTAVDDSTADTNMFLILGALRGFNISMNALRDGQWRGSPAPPLGHDPQDKVLGILGMGGIGRNLMKKAAAFGMTTQYHNRTPLSEELSGGAKYVSFNELLATSDVLSLNLPLNPQTRHIISTNEFNQMKQGIVIVNTARGAVIDEAALVAALKSDKVSSCGLDVFENEPEIHPGLLNNHKVMLLPHMGTWTVETQRKMEIWALDNVKKALTEGCLISQVPEQKGM